MSSNCSFLAQLFVKPHHWKSPLVRFYHLYSFWKASLFHSKRKFASVVWKFWKNVESKHCAKKPELSYFVMLPWFRLSLKAHLHERELHYAVAYITSHCYLVSWNLFRKLVYYLLFWFLLLLWHDQRVSYYFINCDISTFTEYLLNRTEPVLKSLNNLQTSYTEYSTDKEGECHPLISQAACKWLDERYLNWIELNRNKVNAKYF